MEVERILMGNAVVWHDNYVPRAEFERRSGHSAAVVWLTGHSAAGKSTLARKVQRELFAQEFQVTVLDGDNIRHGLNKNLGFAKEDRAENIRRVAEVARLFFDHGFVVLTAFISPYKSDRALARSLIPEGSFFEVYVRCAIEECIRRDPKGLYARALRGEIPAYTGISAPYEPPEAPELVIDTMATPVEVGASRIAKMLHSQTALSSNRER
jgi:adenylylsulfate kinase